LSWLTRSELPKGDGAPSGEGALFLGVGAGEGFLALSPPARRRARTLSAATLQAAGISPGARALLALNADGDLAAALLCDALVEAGASATSVGARGRTRLLAAMRSFKPTVWLTTPTGALDFLARLYLEFNVDPTELDIQHILVMGEVETPGTARRLGDEFEADVTMLYCDPFFSVALAHAREGRWSVEAPQALGLAPLVGEDWIDARSLPDADGPRELVVRPSWSDELADSTLRSGQVCDPGATGVSGLFHHTVGDHLLVRGRWLSLPRMRAALAGIDGIAGLRLEVSRGEGTLDKLVVSLAFDRESLVENPMWAARAREAVASTTPIAFEIETRLAEQDEPVEEVRDMRGHHLGVDRAAVAPASTA